MGSMRELFTIEPALDDHELAALQKKHRHPPRRRERFAFMMRQPENF